MHSRHTPLLHLRTLLRTCPVSIYIQEVCWEEEHPSGNLIMLQDERVRLECYGLPELCIHHGLQAPPQNEVRRRLVLRESVALDSSTRALQQGLQRCRVSTAAGCHAANTCLLSMHSPPLHCCRAGCAAAAKAQLQRLRDRSTARPTRENCPVAKPRSVSRRPPLPRRRCSGCGMIWHPPPRWPPPHSATSPPRAWSRCCAPRRTSRQCWRRWRSTAWVRPIQTSTPLGDKRNSHNGMWRGLAAGAARRDARRGDVGGDGGARHGCVFLKNVALTWPWKGLANRPRPLHGALNWHPQRSLSDRMWNCLSNRAGFVAVKMHPERVQDMSAAGHPSRGMFCFVTYRL